MWEQHVIDGQKFELGSVDSILKHLVWGSHSGCHVTALLGQVTEGLGRSSWSVGLKQSVSVHVTSQPPRLALASSHGSLRICIKMKYKKGVGICLRNGGHA